MIDLSKRFTVRTGWWRARTLQALDRVTFSVHPGEAFGLLGPNGSGKSTLLRLLSTVLLPSHGEARVGGHSIRDTARVKTVLGLVPSDARGFTGLLSGPQNLEFFAALQGVPAQAVRPRIAALLETLGLAALSNQPAWTYSTGQRQRLSLARALLHDPPILLLDEPTKGLDPWGAQTIRRWLREELIQRLGKTVLLATNQLEDVRALCSRAAVLRQGRLAWQGPIAPESGQPDALARYVAHCS